MRRGERLAVVDESLCVCLLAYLLRVLHTLCLQLCVN